MPPNLQATKFHQNPNELMNELNKTNDMISNQHDHNTYNRYKEPIPKELDAIGKLIVDSAYTVHKNLGPGLLEKVYEICFCHELTKRGLSYRRQVDVPVVYDNLVFDEGLRLDVLVENEVICELKAIETVNPVWQAQVLSHLRITSKRLGYLINFNVVNIGQGIKRFAN